MFPDVEGIKSFGGKVQHLSAVKTAIASYEKIRKLNLGLIYNINILLITCLLLSRPLAKLINVKHQTQNLNVKPGHD